MLQIRPPTDSGNAEGLLATPSFRRQAWLELAVAALRVRFTEAGYAIPFETRVSIGWPKRGANCGRVGECWSSQSSSDAHYELFVSPQLTTGADIVETLAHELVHATVGVEAGHKAQFKQCAVRIGLTGPMRATVAGPEFLAWAEELFKRIGLYPGGFLVDTPKQGIRLRKCECPACGYTARVTRKWLTDAGPPICPSDRIPMPETAQPPNGAEIGSAPMKRRRSAFVEEAIATLGEHGHAADIDIGSSGHLKIRWITASGHRRFLVVGQTPSDHRADANARAILRKLLREEGGPR
jgi:hypothetical protein